MDVVELLPQLCFLRFPVGHAYLWMGPDGLTLVDTSLPGSGTLIAEAVRGLGRRPEDLRRLVLTHFHEDHAGSAAEIAAWGDVEVVAHRADAPFLRGVAKGPPPVLARWERPIWDRVHAGGSHQFLPPVRLDRELDDGDVIDLGGGMEAVAVAVPGHTPGSVALHLPEPGVILTGDAAARTPDGQRVILGVFNADPAQAAKSFERLAALDAEVACFGHGEPVLQGAGRELRAARRPSGS
jgi:glyoxylase-like metal-dependent hydrolase (beta-lactamase superfamily II)